MKVKQNGNIQTTVIMPLSMHKQLSYIKIQKNYTLNELIVTALEKLIDESKVKVN